MLGESQRTVGFILTTASVGPTPFSLTPNPRPLTFAFFGAWRSLVARLPWAQEVPGSNPGAPTNFLKSLHVFNRRWNRHWDRVYDVPSSCEAGSENTWALA